MKYNKDFKEKLNKFFSKKNVSKDDFDMIMSLLFKIKDKEPFAFNLNMGKVMLKQNKNFLAKNYLERALKIDYENASVNYNLYKISIIENNFRGAKKYLKSWEKYSNKKIDITIFKSLIDAYIDMEEDYTLFLSKEYKIPTTNLFGLIEINDKVLKEKYRKLIEIFQNKDFNGMESIVLDMKDEIEQKNIAIEVHTLLRIVRNLVQLEKIKRESILKNDENLYVNGKLISLFEFVKYVRRTIPKDIKKAEQLFSYIDKLYPTIRDQDIIKTLNGMIIEYKEYHEVPQEQKNNYEWTKEKAKAAYLNGDFEQAFDYYLTGYYLTGQNIFNYYLGKMLYKKKRFNEAKEYFEEYLKIDGDKNLKSLVYLYNIEPSEELLKMIRKSESVFYPNFHFKDIRYLECDDRKKYKAMKKIKMNCNEFNDTNFFPNNSNIKEQLITIRDMLKKHEQKQANKLLRQLEKQQSQMTFKEKQTFYNLQKNKKLYRNQG